jgi:hypothetical protein
MNKDIQVAMVSKPALDLRLLPEDILIIIEVGGKEKFVGKNELLKMLQGCVVSSAGTQTSSSTMSCKPVGKTAHAQDLATRRKIGVSTSFRHLCLAADARDFERVGKIIERAVENFGGGVLKELEAKVRDSELDANAAAKVLKLLKGTQSTAQSHSVTSKSAQKPKPKPKKTTALQKRRSSKRKT